MTLGQCALYLRQCWLSASGRAAALDGYRALGRQHRATLTDIGLRNGVFVAAGETEPHKLAYAAGRRDAALEIFALAHADAAALYDLIERKPQKENRT